MAYHYCPICGKDYDCGRIRTEMDLGISCISDVITSHRECEKGL